MTFDFRPLTTPVRIRPDRPIVAKHLQQKKEMGEAQEATETRDKALDKLAHWISDLRAVAKVALEENSQQLEKLGILARTR